MRCAYCDAQLDSQTITIDHIRPLSKGGSVSIFNCAGACEPCNTAKGSKDLRTMAIPYASLMRGRLRLLIRLHAAMITRDQFYLACKRLRRPDGLGWGYLFTSEILRRHGAEELAKLMAENGAASPPQAGRWPGTRHE
jgi:hypothetical protein